MRPAQWAAARQLAQLVLTLGLATEEGMFARKLARQVLGGTEHGQVPDLVPVTTHGVTRLVPRQEPVVVLRSQATCPSGMDDRDDSTGR